MIKSCQNNSSQKKTHALIATSVSTAARRAAARVQTYGRQKDKKRQKSKNRTNLCSVLTESSVSHLSLFRVKTMDELAKATRQISGPTYFKRHGIRVAFSDNGKACITENFC